MPRFSTACTPTIRPRVTAAELREAPAPTSLSKGDRVYLVGEPACVGIVRFMRDHATAVVDWTDGRRGEPPMFLLRVVGA